MLFTLGAFASSMSSEATRADNFTLAEERGFVPGAVCATMGDPAIHRGCKHRKMFETGQVGLRGRAENGWAIYIGS